jgi:predicted transcriptional regulator YdeE
MECRLIKLEAFTLAGLSYYGDPLSTKGGWDEENEIGKTWHRFSNYMSNHPNRAYKLDRPYYYEVHIYNDNTFKNGHFEVFIGEETSTHEVDINLSTKFIPGGTYVLSTLKGQEIIQDWWKELTCYVQETYNKNLNSQFIIQRYDDRFKGMDKIDDSELDVLILLEV